MQIGNKYTKMAYSAKCINNNLEIDKKETNTVENSAQKYKYNMLTASAVRAELIFQREGVAVSCIAAGANWKTNTKCKTRTNTIKNSTNTTKKKINISKGGGCCLSTLHSKEQI